MLPLNNWYYYRSQTNALCLLSCNQYFQLMTYYEDAGRGRVFYRLPITRRGENVPVPGYLPPTLTPDQFYCMFKPTHSLHQCFGSGSGSGLDPDPGRQKCPTKNIKKVNKFLFLKCWMFSFRAEGISSSLDVL
jgi:hypothetical protein